jgi:Holliday junction DNA helicase RuvA
MIDYLRGRLVHIETDYVVLDVHDVGYRVFTPNPYALARTEEPVQLFIHYHVREDAVQLFGFSTRQEQELFRKLLEVSGIGPKVALGVLSGGRPETIAAAIQQENIGFLTKLPGIGRKTAQRMILDLKDKLGAIDSSADEVRAEPVATVGSGEAEFSSWAAAREALSGLGYREAEIDRAWNALKDHVSENDTPDILIKKALQQLFQG